MSDTHSNLPDADEHAGPTMMALLPALIVALLTLAAGTASAYAPPATGEMAVVFPPGTGELEALGRIAAAGGLFVGPSRFGNIVIVLAPDSGFAARVAQQGALFTAKATGFCGPAST